MAELSDEASETEMLSHSLSIWYGEPLGADELPLDLHTAASIGQFEVVQQCVRRREIDLNQQNLGGWTPLMYASYIGHDAVVSLLLEAGADVNCSNPCGQTPLMLAASCGNESVAYFLLQQGAELEARDSRGWTALFHCTSSGHQRMLRFLLENGANGDVKEPLYGFTPLMEAAVSGHEIIVQHLLNHGVKLMETDRNGDNARMLAARFGHSRIVSLLDSHRTRVSRTHGRGSARNDDFSSSDESSTPQRPRPQRKAKGPSIHDGPQALAKITSGGNQADIDNEVGRELVLPRCYIPINDHDVESNGSSRDEEDTGRLQSSSREGLCHNADVSSEASIESNEGESGLPNCRLSNSVLALETHPTLGLRTDLREGGITLFGPKRKMTSAIARWHSSARPTSDGLEQAYADRRRQKCRNWLYRDRTTESASSPGRELRAVAEGCLMEQDSTWRNFRCQLETTYTLATDASKLLYS
ncbi:hypothetical protein GDO86_017480 [Hymenochirus boettgeri]|uniref:Ankyrin repeat and sterile alpha motif domain containing 3 n=1 Tax=Hymenochirus boettgeri TaxID=247094 RepID=A0A8T2ISQ7_9PIPI|nr:hypothetical protein GDO86_017480 [Hymenochirus boettgeri]